MAVFLACLRRKEEETETAAGGRPHHPNSGRLGLGHLMLFDAKELVREDLKEVGRELGVR